MKKIVNFCPTGTQTRRDNSYAPLTAVEIVEEVIEANELGITLVHIHARDESLQNTYEKKWYRPIIEGIRNYCPHLTICVSLSGRYFSEINKRTEVLELLPDMGSLSMSSMNFPNGAAVNDPNTILGLIEEMKEFAVYPEIECFDSGMLNYTKYLINKKILDPPYYINVIFGNLFNIQTELSSFANIVSNIPHTEAKICFGGIGKEQLKSNVMGLLYADGVRIGLEDNLYYKDNVKATNLDLLKRLHNIMDELNYQHLEPLTFKNYGFSNNFRKK